MWNQCVLYSYIQSSTASVISSNCRHMCFRMSSAAASRWSSDNLVFAPRLAPRLPAHSVNLSRASATIASVMIAGDGSMSCFSRICDIRSSIRRRTLRLLSAMLSIGMARKARNKINTRDIKGEKKDTNKARPSLCLGGSQPPSAALNVELLSIIARMNT